MANQEREQFEITMKSRKNVIGSNEPLDRFRMQCLTNGASTISGMARRFRIMDDDGSKTLSLLEFKEGIKGFGLDITDEDIEKVFQQMDEDGSGQVSITEFIVKLRGPMKPGRIKLIEAAFKLMDKSGDGVITPDDLKGVYDVRKHPKYQNGDWSEEKVFSEFLKNFEGAKEADGIVTYDEFLDYYTAISASIDADSYFSLMMRNSFKNLTV